MKSRADAEQPREAFSKLEQVKREELRRRYRETTPGQRVDGALRLSELAAELKSGLRTRVD